MTIEYELSEKECLDFIFSHILETSLAKYQLLIFKIFLILLCILSFLILHFISAIIINVLYIFILLKLNSFYLSGLKKRLKKSNYNIIFFNKLLLSLKNDSLFIKTQYESIEIPFSTINYIYNSNKYIFILNKVSKDILLPTHIFESEIEKKNFLDTFKNLLISDTFPKNYSIIAS